MTEHDRDDEDFATAWAHDDEHDVGADTAEFEAFRADDDTAELLRRRVRGDRPGDQPADQPADRSAARPEQPDATSRGPSTALLVAVLAVVFVVVAVLYLAG